MYEVPHLKVLDVLLLFGQPLLLLLLGGRLVLTQFLPHRRCFYYTTPTTELNGYAFNHISSR